MDFVILVGMVFREGHTDLRLFRYLDHGWWKGWDHLLHKEQQAGMTMVYQTTENGNSAPNGEQGC